MAELFKASKRCDKGTGLTVTPAQPEITSTTEMTTKNCNSLYLPW